MWTTRLDKFKLATYQTARFPHKDSDSYLFYQLGYLGGYDLQFLVSDDGGKLLCF